MTKRKHSERVCFQNFAFAEDHCREALAKPWDPMWEGWIHFSRCSFHDRGCLIFEMVAKDTGPTTLDFGLMEIDTASLRDALTRTKTLAELHMDRLVDLNVEHIGHGLKHNRSLFYLGFYMRGSYSERENWFDNVMVPLQQHSKLAEVIFFVGSRPVSAEGSNSAFLAEEESEVEDIENNNVYNEVPADQEEIDDGVSNSRVDRNGQVLLEMAKCNKLLWNLNVSDHVVDNDMWNDVIDPIRSANGWRNHAKELAQENDPSLRRGLLGKALVDRDVNRDPTAMFMFVSKFPDLLSQMVKQKKKKNKKTTNDDGSTKTKRRRQNND